MTTVVCPVYLPNVYYCSWLVAQEKILFVEDTHFQKQTFRNRCEIYGANGTLKLTVPISHRKNQAHQKENKVQIANTTAWQKQHWRSLCSAYRSSPYFEFYEADLAPFFNQEATLLMKFNLELIEKIMELIEEPFQYQIVPWNDTIHKRMDTLLNAKKKIEIEFEPYRQVFENKKGFIGNLSIVDLLFNLGPNTGMYLKRQASLVP